MGEGRRMSEEPVVADDKVKPYSYMHFYYCSECGGQIGSGGLCSWQCNHDAHVGSRPVKIVTYKLESIEDGPPDAYARVTQ
jgi:hypothetical protein